MRHQQNLDKEFLRKLDSLHEREVYARIELMTFDELPIETIEGKITTGSINIDGSSAVRRSCSLTMVTNDQLYKQYMWGLKSKFNLAVGLKNTIDSNYPDIIWFNEGIYLITSFNTSQSASNYTISIQGKDKMCLLNGDLGGSLPASIDFGQEEVIKYNYIVQDNNFNYDAAHYCFRVNSEEEAKKYNNYYIATNGNEKIYYVLDENKTKTENRTYYYRERISELVKVPIKTIIKKALMVYGKELESNIVINDLDEYGYELLQNKCDADMYFFRDAETGRIVNVVIGDNLPNLYKENHEPISLKQIIFDQLDSYKLLGKEDQEPTTEPTRIILTLDTSSPTVYTIAKKSYGEPVGYRICDLVYAGDLITTVGETLTSVLDKIKNMLSCFEYFYDIDGRFIFQRKKFYDFKSWNNIVKKSEGESYIEPAVYSSSYTYSFKDSQIVTQFANNPQINILRNDFSIWGQRKSASGEELPIHMRYAIDTKPVQYTTIIVTQDDINRYKTLTYNNEIFQTMNLQLKQQTFKAYPEDGDPADIIYCDWREIIYRMAVDYYQYNYGDDFLHKVAAANPTLYPSGVTGYETYYADIFSFWRQIYDFEHRTFYDNVKQYPENLDFWFDFIGEENSDISKYSIKLIGDRTKAVNDTNIKVISYRDVPEVLFLNQGDYDRIVENNYPQETGYVWVNVPKNYDNYFSISSMGKSAIDEMEDLLQTTAYCTESSTITTLPVYYLEPNTKIYIEDKKSGVEGEYLVNKLTIPLSYNGTMSISATKAISKVY